MLDMGSKKNQDFDMKSWVLAGYYGWIESEKVDFIDIEETIYGDRMYFNYNGEGFQSLIIYGKYRP